MFAAAPAPKAAVRKRDWRMAAAVVLAIAAAILTPLAMVGSWTHHALMERSGFVAALQPLSRDPVVRDYLRSTLTRQLNQDTKLHKEVQDALPTGMGLTTGSVSSQVESVIEDATAKLFDTGAFDTAWRRSLAEFQPRLAAFIQREGPLATGSNGVASFDLKLGEELIGVIGSGLSLPATFRPSAGASEVGLLQLGSLSGLRNALSLVDRFRWVFIAGASLCLLGALAFARRRLRALVPVGAMVAVTVVASYMGLFAVGSMYLDAAYRAEIPVAVSQSVWTALTQTLSRSMVLVIALAAVAGLSGWIGLRVARNRAPAVRPSLLRRQFEALRVKRASDAHSMDVKARW